jgi:hypothetical protein
MLSAVCFVGIWGLSALAQWMIPWPWGLVQWVVATLFLILPAGYLAVCGFTAITMAFEALRAKREE